MDPRQQRRPRSEVPNDARSVFLVIRSHPGHFHQQTNDMTNYPEIIYGWCFSRTLHFIASLRYHHPRRRILIVKYDCSDAYRRIAHSAHQATHQTISIVDNRAHMALRLTFGGSPNPPTWCAMAEVVTDHSNEINHCPQWDHFTVHSPVQTIFPAKFLPDHVPISQAFEMSTCPYPTEAKKVDDFIDDLKDSSLVSVRASW
jgi:hypothetical protein